MAVDSPRASHPATFMGGVRLSRGGWSWDVALVMPVYETGQGSPAPLLTIAKAF